MDFKPYRSIQKIRRGGKRKIQDNLQHTSVKRRQSLPFVPYPDDKYKQVGGKQLGNEMFVVNI